MSSNHKPYNPARREAMKATAALGTAAGALWALPAGLIKAYRGGHEVITTIMLNYVAFYLLSYMLATPGLLQAPGSSNTGIPAHSPGASRYCTTRCLPPMSK